LNGTDLRREPLENRKATLASLLRRSPAGIQLVEHIEAEHGGTVFDHACRLGLEGIVSKRRALPFRPQRNLAQDEEPRAPGDAARMGGTVTLLQKKCPRRSDTRGLSSAWRSGDPD